MNYYAVQPEALANTFLVLTMGTLATLYVIYWLDKHLNR